MSSSIHRPPIHRILARRVLGAAILSASAVLPAIALAEAQMREVVVTAIRSPFSIDQVPATLRVIDRDTIERSGARGLSDLLRHHGAIQISDSQGFNRDTRLSLRGFGATSNALVLVDGRKLNNTDMSSPDLAQVVLANVERIEILEGDASVIHGDQAVGGVINIITRRTTEARGQVSAEVGSYGNHHYRAHYEDRLEQGFFYRIGGDREHSDGYRRGSELDFEQFTGHLGYGYEGGELYWEGVRSDSDFTLAGALTDAQRRQARRQAGSSFNEYAVDTRVHRLVWDHSLTEQLRWLVDYSDRDEDAVIAGRSMTFGDSVTGQSRHNRMFSPRLIWQGEGWRATTGLDVERVDYDFALESAFGSSASSQRHRKRSPWAQLNLSATDRLDLQAGVRRAHLEVDVDPFAVDYDRSVTVYQAGANWRGDGWRAFLNHGQSFRFPLADENVNMITGELNLLEVQRGRNWEAGGELVRDTVLLKASLFEQRTRDEIGYDSGVFANVNFDDTRRRGITLEANWEVTELVALSGLYRWLDARFQDGPYEDNRIPVVARDLFKLQASVRATDWLDGYLEWAYHGPQYLDLANGARQGGYSLTNLALRANWASWSLQARVNNLTDKRYTEFVSFFGVASYYPSPERHYSLTLAYDF